MTFSVLINSLLSVTTIIIIIIIITIIIIIITNSDKNIYIFPVKLLKVNKFYLFPFINDPFQYFSKIPVI